MAARKRSSLLEAAKRGDEDAIETLTIEDIDLYSMVSRRIAHEDVYSIIDTCFMPCGVECDQYAVIGEITGRIPLGVIPPEEDCAKSVLFFLSDYAKMVTGATLDVNGGQYMAP